MIKKLLSIATFCAIFSVANAQTNLVANPASLTSRNAVIETPSPYSAPMMNQKTSSANIADTLWYFFNKTYYKNPSGSYYTFALSTTGTLVTHAGSRFQNSGNLAVAGLEGLFSKATTASSLVTAHVILCNVSAGQPVLPGIDSVSIVLTATNTSGYFYGANFTTPKFVAGDYAVVVRNGSTNPNDTLKVWMTNGLTTTFGEGMGHMRVGGTFTNTTNLFGSPANNDFEIIVAPRVAFTASAAQTSPTTTPYCNGTAYTFTNSSSYWLGHRQYNLNEFARRWAPLTNTVSTIMKDSVYTWNFGDGTGNFYTTSGMPNINHTYTTTGAYSGTLTAKYQKGSDYAGITVIDNATFAKTSAVCSGIQNLSGVEAVNVYPNPSSGLVYIANLPSESTIEVVNMLGQSVYKATANAGNFTADLSTLNNGSYFVKINSINEKTKIVKLILN